LSSSNSFIIAAVPIHAEHVRVVKEIESSEIKELFFLRSFQIEFGAGGVRGRLYCLGLDYTSASAIKDTECKRLSNLM